MKPLHYLLIVDVILALIFIKLIFRTGTVFSKAILGWLLSDFDQDIDALKRWDKENDIQHKMNLFYAAIIAIALTSFFIYEFVM
jgi:hypothetical protein